MSMERIARQHRKTKETDIQIILNLDGRGESHLDTGIEEENPSRHLI